MKMMKTVTRTSRWKILDSAFSLSIPFLTTCLFSSHLRRFWSGIGDLHALWRFGLDDLIFFSKAQKEQVNFLSFPSPFLIKYPPYNKYHIFFLTGFTSYQIRVKLPRCRLTDNLMRYALSGPRSGNLHHWYISSSAQSDISDFSRHQALRSVPPCF